MAAEAILVKIWAGSRGHECSSRRRDSAAAWRRIHWKSEVLTLTPWGQHRAHEEQSLPDSLSEAQH